MQTQNNQIPNTPNSQIDDDEINLMDILLVIAKYNRFILAFTAVSAMLAFVYALRQPVMYTSNALILPPQASMSQTSILMGQLSSLGLGAGLGLGSGSGSGASTGMLIKSQKLAYQVVKRLDLQSLYKVKNVEAARSALASVTKVTINKDGSILIECSDKDPKMAALLASTYVEELDRFNNTIAITNASRMRLYLEKQLKLANETLANIELAMEDSQKNTDLTPLEVQGGTMAALVATIRSQITANEMQLASLRVYATEQNPQYQKTILSLAVLRAKLQKLEGANEVSDNDGGGIKKASKTGSVFFNNMRDLKYQQTLVETLKKQYDIAKMDEAKDANLIQVINEPLIPEQPSKPQRDLIISIGVILGLLFSIILAFIRNALDAAKQKPELAERLNLLRRYLQSGK
jgi:tyrosine-protein kinase Etk/Wzc